MANTIKRPATVEFTEDGWTTKYTGRVLDETFYSYKVDSFEYGLFWLPKANCRVLDYYLTYEEMAKE